ncbi:MAG TPA: YihY/virulence factor BrkB family protein [Candidatus Saccharimonadales bacterium]|nr:YihY/virulence factor BrkB family protein [Candidatus Saccharimonadales bacterium]
MDKIKWPLKTADKLQQRFKPVAFTAAVIKKYSEDDGGRLAALITYYGFLSLFPLLLVATSLIHILLTNNQELQDRIINGITDYFPSISPALQTSIQGFHSSGLALLLGILFTLYGARGGAAAIRFAFNQIWQVPKKDRLGFPQSIINSFLIIFVGGGGLILAAVLSGYAAGLNHTHAYKLIPFAISYGILIGIFYLVFSLGISSTEPSRKDLLVSALAAATGAQILQIIGGYLVSHQLQHLSSLYGTFAVVLGLFFWIYLQAQILLLATSAGAVRSKRLWPISLF